jgi:hypothetical protein
MNEMPESIKNDIVSSIVFQINDGTVFHGTQAGIGTEAKPQQTALPMEGFTDDLGINSSNTETDTPF